MGTSRRSGKLVPRSRAVVRRGGPPGAGVHQDRLRTGTTHCLSRAADRTVARIGHAGNRTRHSRRHRDDAFSIISTVPMGAEIVSAAAHPGIGLLLDAWHVFRAGTSLEELPAALAPEMIFGVELDDAGQAVVGTHFEDTVNHRLLCGEGSFDLRGLVALLRDKGFDGPWGGGDPVVRVPTASGSAGRQAGRSVGADGALISRAP